MVMKLTPYLQFREGKCREALDFYGRILGGDVAFTTTFGDAHGSPVGEDWLDKVMHAEFRADGFVLFACDAPPQFQRPAGGVALTLTVETAQEAERIFAALGESGDITMPMDETFWATRFGMLTDRYGMSWMVSCDKPTA